MKNLIFLACALCAVNAIPVPSAEQPNELEILQIPIAGNKEIDIVSLAENEGTTNERNKRTIGVLRELFPELSKIVEQKIQMLLPILLRTVGPILLRSGIGGALGGAGAGGGGSSSDDFDDDDDDDDDDKNSISGANGRKVSISLPTFPPDDDDEEEDDVEIIKEKIDVSSNEPAQMVSSSTIDSSTLDNNISSTTVAATDLLKTESTEINLENKLDIRTEDNEDDNAVALGSAPYVYVVPPKSEKDCEDALSPVHTKHNENSIAANGDESLDIAALSEKLETLNRVVRAAQLDASTAEQNGVDQIPAAASDAQAVATDAKAPAIDELSLDNEENDENRNKRFLSFGFGGGAGGGGSGGGSGNFLFDIIRNTADRAARTAGTVYRVVAGTESLGIDDKNNKNNISASAAGSTTTIVQQQNEHGDKTARIITEGLSHDGLVSGSVSTEQSDERENAAVDGGDAGKSADGYTEGIPGPVTRLFVLANRGLANLVQDLILRIAQTSERVVNFKARLITSLI